MFDLFGTDKVNAKGSIEAMTKGMTLGVIDAYEWRLQEKNDRIKKLEIEIETLKEKIEEIKEEKNTFTVKPCKADIFKGISCLSDENQYGFFNSDHDIRPSHAIWFKKSEAERLYLLFRKDLICGE